jgi:transposase
LEKQQSQQAHVCLEPTGKYSKPVAEYFYDKGFKVCMANPARVSYYRDSAGARNKTDRGDAYIIADYYRTQNPHLWSPPRPETEELQEMTRYLDSLKGMCQQEKNRLSSGYKSNAIRRKIRSGITFLNKQIADVEKHIQEHIEKDAELRHQRDLLVTIPGIGMLTAAKLMAEIQDIDRFKTAAQLAAYAGVTPKIWSSGSSVHKKSKMSKVGNVHLRRAIFLPALVAKRYNPIVKAFSERLLENGKLKCVVTGACMRKLLHIVFGVLKNDIPFDPNFASNP